MGTEGFFENFRFLAAVIASHPKQELYGRTRLQKEIKLLQRVGFPTDYSYSMYFYGPYSAGVQADIGLLESFGLVEEKEKYKTDGSSYFVFHANPPANLEKEMEPYQKYIDIFEKYETDILELAATYDSFCELGLNPEEALESLRLKKGRKCTDENEKKSFELLEEFDLYSFST